MHSSRRFVSHSLQCLGKIEASSLASSSATSLPAAIAQDGQATCASPFPSSSPFPRVLAAAAALLAGFAATASAETPAAPEQKGSFALISDERKRQVFFHYERRIRDFSSSDKVFEYFASVKGADGCVYMTPMDLMRSLVPVYPPSVRPVTISLPPSPFLLPLLLPFSPYSIALH